MSRKTQPRRRDDGDSVRTEVDPVTFEVIRHRLQSINEEQAVTLKAVSGSPIVSEADDYNVGLYRSHGELLAMGRTVIYHAASMSEMVKHVIADCGDDPGIDDGDSFVLNSPYKGALHLPDIGVLTPFFHEGARIGWSGSVAHQLDIGGMEHGGFMPGASDLFQEGMIIPPVKLVERGRPRSDVWRMLEGMSRLPAALSLNLRGMVAANRVGITGVHDLIDRYGVDVVLSVMDGVMDLSEREVRQRIGELPDGVFRAQSFLDHDGRENKLYRVAVTLTKSNDSLHFDYVGSSEQADGFVNCTRTGLIAGVYAAVLPILAYDLPWNEGIFRAVTVDAPPGTVVNALPPAPSSQGPLGGMWMVEMTATEALSKLVALHPTLAMEAQASPAGGVDLFNPSGLDQYGEYSGWIYLDQMLTGGGAYGHRDGLGPQGQRCITACRVPNIESVERTSPILYLYRRMLIDAAGPGRTRGGQSAGAAMVLHNALWLKAVVGGHGFESPTSKGIFGGYPAKTNQRRLLRNSNIWDLLAEEGRLPTSLDDLEGTEEHLPAKTPPFMLGPSDVFEWTPQAGGGWGDPLERDPREVARDVVAGVVSAATAANVYGVILDSYGGADATGTTRLRSDIRSDRARWPQESIAPPVPDGLRWIAPYGDALNISAGPSGPIVVACACGGFAVDVALNWKRYARWRPVESGELGPRVRIHEDLEPRFYACPSCARLLDVEVGLENDSPLFDVQLDAASFLTARADAHERSAR